MKIQPPRFRFRQEYFLFLLPLFFVFHGFTEHYSLVPVTNAFGLAGYYLLVSVVLAVIAFFLFRSWRKACVFTVALMAYHFFFGSLHDFSKSLLGDLWLTRYTFILIVSLLALLIFTTYLKRTNRSFNRFTRYCNLLLLVLIALDGMFLVTKILSHTNETALPAGLVRCDTCNKPDIYLIIADEYAGKQELKDLFQYDNTPFEQELAKRGFQVVQQPRSNYNFTPFSVASILTYNFLPLKNPDHAAPETGMVMDLIKNSPVQKYLSAMGYQVYNNSYFDLAGLPTESVETFLPTKTKFITAQTFLSRLDRDIGFNLITRFHIQWIIKKSMYHNLHNNDLLYRKTLEVAKNNVHPKFCYTHLMLPHFPYYYTENGNLNSYESIFEDKDKQKYLQYLRYANKKYLFLVDQILKSSKQPPLVIFMSDHGFRDGTIQNQKYAFMNVCAVHFPRPTMQMRDSASNINVFRQIFNQQFHQHLPMLKDTSIFLTD